MNPTAWPIALAAAATPVAVALLVDRWFGEPAARWHPVVRMGGYLGPVLCATQSTASSRTFQTSPSLPPGSISR